MAGVLLQSAGGPAATSPSATAYFNFVAAGGTNATEANTQQPSRSLGVYSNLNVRITSNDVGVSTLRFRMSSVSGSQAVSIAASTTGFFQDSVNTDAPTAGQLVNSMLTAGAGGTGILSRLNSVVFSAGNNN